MFGQPWAAAPENRGARSLIECLVVSGCFDVLFDHLFVALHRPAPCGQGRDLQWFETPYTFRFFLYPTQTAHAFAIRAIHSRYGFRRCPRLSGCRALLSSCASTRAERNLRECALPGQDALTSHMADTVPPSFRVLSFVFHTSYSGRIAVDGFGLVRSSLCASRVGLHAPRSRRRALAQLLARSLRRFRPAVVVLGIAQDETARSRALRVAAERLLGTLTEVPIVCRTVRAGRLALCGASIDRRAHALAHAIVSKFLPELAHLVPASRREHPRRRSLWHAAAVALHELIRRFPRAAAALARPAALRCQRLSALIARADRRRPV